ncbi:MAG: transposase domain-containing protein [Nannocystaceae bacterium]
MLQTIVSTCQIRDVNPETYLRDVLVRVGQPGVNVTDLMPWNWIPVDAG